MTLGRLGDFSASVSSPVKWDNAASLTAARTKKRTGAGLQHGAQHRLLLVLQFGGT